MRVNIFWVIALIVLPVVSYAQVDTLELVEIGNIQASSEITELYVEDLDGDSLKEIILCTDYFVYIYDSQSYQVEWTSPPLLAPTDLLFEDINSDGLIDLSVKDSTNIHLFDPHTPGTIWTSPQLDSTYKCYTIGDRNNDGWIDVAIVTKEPFTRPEIENNMDTVWVKITEGPNYNIESELILLMLNYSFGYDPQVSILTEPQHIIFTSLDGQSGLIRSICVYAEVETEWQSPEFSHGFFGTVYIVNANSFFLNYEYGVGRMFFYDNCSYETDSVLAVLGRTYGIFFDMSSEYRSLIILDADTTRALNTLQEHSSGPYYEDGSQWRGLIIDNIFSTNDGKEIVFGLFDVNLQTATIYCYSYPEYQFIDEYNLTDSLYSIIAVFRSNNLFENPQILYSNLPPDENLYFLDLENEIINGLLDFSGSIDAITDLNYDHIDEILSIQGNALSIYNLDYATGVGDNTSLPQMAFLRPNYPNPFNSSTTIEYGLAEAGQVNIEIYDLLGRKVETLVNEEKQAGRHQVVWEADRYASGLYFYRIEAGDYSDTKRMVYLK